MYVIKLNRFINANKITNLKDVINNKTKVKENIIDEELNEERKFLLEKLGENILYNKQKKEVILLNRNKKLNIIYFQNMLYKVNLSFERRNMNQNIYARENVLSEQSKRHIKIIINDQPIENVGVYERVESIKVRDRNRYTGELFIDEEKTLYIYLEDELYYRWTSYDKINKATYGSNNVVSKQDSSKPFLMEQMDKMVPYIDKWIKDDDTLIENILEQYQQSKDIKYSYELANEFKEEIRDIDRELTVAYDLCYVEFDSKYFVTKRDSSVLRNERVVKDTTKLSDIELIIKGEIKVLLEQYGYHKEILDKLYNEEQSITDFVESVILSMIDLDWSQRNMLMLSYRGVFRKQINQNIRDTINYYKRKEGIREENFRKFIK